jgi:hypothetical protein
MRRIVFFWVLTPGHLPAVVLGVKTQKNNVLIPVMLENRT